MLFSLKHIKDWISVSYILAPILFVWEALGTEFQSTIRKKNYNDKRITTRNNFMIEKNVCPKKYKYCGILTSIFEKG